MIMSAGGCVATLPFGDLTGGIERPVASYALDDGTGITVNEASGKHPGQIDQDDGKYAPKWTAAGRRGGAVEFAYEDGWIYVPSLSLADFPRRATYTAWVKFKTFGNDSADALSIDEENGDPEHDEDDTVISIFFDARGVHAHLQILENEQREVSAPPVPLDRWTFIALTWDLPANKATFYVRMENEPLSGGHFYETDLPPRFEIRRPLFNFQANGGTLDDVRIWREPFPRDIIERLYSE
jgi:hypothetical protein